MKILVTGVTGFIGSRLALWLACTEHSILGLGFTNTPAEEQNLLELQQKNIKVAPIAIDDVESLMDALSGVDIVFHLAAAQHEANVADDYFRRINVLGTKNIMDAAVSNGVGRVVYGSTIGVYGAAMEGELSELSNLEPDNIYGKTKLEAEQLVLSYQSKIAVTAIRISETYGPGDRRLLKLFKAVGNHRFFMIGKGENIHQLIYVDDLIAGLYKAATEEKALGAIIVLAGREKLTTDKMVNKIAAKLAVSPLGIRAPLWLFTFIAIVMEQLLTPIGIQPPLHRRRLDFFRKSFYFNTSKAERLLHFSPAVSFDAGVEKTAQWYKEKKLL